MIRLLVNAQSAFFGGGLEYLKNQLKALREEHPDIHLILWTHEKNHREFLDYLGKRGITYVKTPYFPYYIRFIVEQILCPLLAKKYRADVVYMPGNVACFLTLKKQILIFQNPNLFFNVIRKRSIAYNLKRMFQRFLARLSILRADRVIFISYNLLHRAVKKPKQNHYVLYSGVNIEEGIEQFDIKSFKPYILAVSNITYHKNYPALLKSFEILSNKYHDLHLVVAGKIMDKKYFENITAPYKGKEIWKRIHFLGGIEHKYLGSLYSNSICYVSTTLLEAFPLTPFEAMYFGTPVLVSDASSLPEICGSAAIYLNPHDPVDIANKISLILENNKLREELIKRGKNHIKSYTWKKHATKFYEILTS